MFSLNSEQVLQTKHQVVKSLLFDGFFCFYFRCWFGKRAGVYTDYIYQGPMILVLVVREPVLSDVTC